LLIFVCFLLSAEGCSLKVNGKSYRSIWFNEADQSVGIFDQTRLPHEIVILSLRTLDDACHAISSMQVRGAPLIGAVAAYGMYLALLENDSLEHEVFAADKLVETRPTAINLRWAVNVVRQALEIADPAHRIAAAQMAAQSICDDDVASCSRIGDFGLGLFESIWAEKQSKDPAAKALNVLTHCNAGWLATVDWGTALAPIYKAHDAGIPVHVWVDETRPRNQGALLTAFELGQHGVAHTVIADNTGGHLMQHAQVDLCIVGTDRTTANGDVCNKIGTYLKALAAKDNEVPFFVALPSSTVDWDLLDGVNGVPIEERDPTEVSKVYGVTIDPVSGKRTPGSVHILPEGSRAANYAFDVTPARLITSLITDQGVFDASEDGLKALKQRLAGNLCE
jgi:methylthioribose-1-phosphate isomerase